MPKIQRSSYSAAEKLKVLQYAELYGIRVAARHFNIDHSMISRGGKIEEKLKLAKGKNRRIGSGRKEKYNVICKWILEAWAEIPKEMIIKSFKKCGISNAMDGSEDDLFGQMEEEIDKNEREIVDIDSDSADELEEKELE